MKRSLKRFVSKLCDICLSLILPCKVVCRGFCSGLKRKKLSKTAGLVVGEFAHLKGASLMLSEECQIEVGSRSRLNNVVFHLSGSRGRVIIGEDCIISNTEFWIEDDSNQIVIGDNTFIVGAHIAVTGNGKTVQLGSDSMLSSGIVIRTGDSHAILDRISGDKINPEEDVVIENHVWVAQNATILKGSHIGRDSVIGCNSVVSGEFAPNSMIAGVPAKVIKSEITWSENRML